MIIRPHADYPSHAVSVDEAVELALQWPDTFHGAWYGRRSLIVVARCRVGSVSLAAGSVPDKLYFRGQVWGDPQYAPPAEVDGFEPHEEPTNQLIPAVRYRRLS